MPTDGAPSGERFVWTSAGPVGGFISSIAFHPGKPNEVWLSGDDSSGLYRSTDAGATWSLVATPPNQSSYSLAFDPSDANKIYAINHFGRGVLKSTDGGATWTAAQAGLPSTGTAKHVYRVAINPLHPERIVAATDAGLFRSTDGAGQFSKVTAAESWGSTFKAVSYSTTGRLFAGASNGEVRYSDNDGDSWTHLTTGSGTGVYHLEASKHALYVLFDGGVLLWYRLPDLADGGFLNTTEIANGLHMGLSVIPGASRATDLIYVGTSRVGSLAQNRTGLFKSVDGGATWTRQQSALTDESIFSVSVSPHNHDLVLAGSVRSGGVYRTTDGGATWAPASSSVFANSALGFAQNPANGQELLVSSTVGLGLGKSFHSRDGGDTWAELPEVSSTDGVISWDIDPSNAQTVLAGMFTTGAFRSTQGPRGPWQRVIDRNVRIGRIYHDHADPRIVYAVAYPYAAGNLADARIYYSMDSGAGFAIRPAAFAVAVAPHPVTRNEAISVSDDAYVTIDGFATQTSLGLKRQATAEGAMTAVAFHPSQPGHVLVGGKLGGVFRTTSYSARGNVSWTQVASPVIGTPIRDLRITVEGTKTIYYLTTVAVDVEFAPTDQPGLFRSDDEGQSWVEVSADLRPCTSVLHFFPQAGAPDTFWAGLWGGGVARLKVTRPDAIQR